MTPSIIAITFGLAAANAYTAKDSSHKKRADLGLLDVDVWEPPDSHKTPAEIEEYLYKAELAISFLAKLSIARENELAINLILQENLLFEPDEAILKPCANMSLDPVVRPLLKLKNRRVIIEGYNNSSCSEMYNLALSSRRAESVGEYLAECGYPEVLITTRGFSKEKTLDTNNNAEKKSTNCRVEITIVKQPVVLKHHHHQQ